MKRRVEELLRGGVPAARREPTPALRAHVAAALGAGASGIARITLPARPVGWAAWRERMKRACVAASVMVAVGFWAVGLLGVLRGDAEPSAARMTAASVGAARSSRRLPWDDGLPAVQDLAAGATRAVDDPLLAELEDIAQDAERAARFLVGRLPASLVARATQDTPR